MKLTRLKGSTLKVYLILVEERGVGDWCPLSSSALSRIARLSRTAVNEALDRLEGSQLVVYQNGGWWVRTEPLEWLLPPWRDEEALEGVLPLAEAWD
jgi:DNA-binding FadR family transcriptional regulator